ncbi:hypothetical protein [Tenggerimyces flavus]|uniref:hypothetical protein n=1 Tax=Tenggerimyces flavus TaxID=1708749 RepID=UPI0019621668|nr:hypothetical protein [Tenggerimyces flavus]MBM7790109.1 hypothetical protein [Tenggerimyces flavus]
MDVVRLPELAAALDCTVTYLLGLTSDPASWEPARQTQPVPPVPARAVRSELTDSVGQPAQADRETWILGPDVPERRVRHQ